MKDLRQRVSDYLSQVTDSTKNLIERVQGYMVYTKENPIKAREEITDLVRENFRKGYERVGGFVTPEEAADGLLVLGTTEYIFGMYTMTKAQTEGLIDIGLIWCLIGASMIFTGFAVGLTFHNRHNKNYQHQG